jgi:cytochrome c peroxidase
VEHGKIEGSVENIMMFEVEVFFNTDISKLNASQYYREEFRKVFKVGTITSKEVAYALAQFFRTMISSNSKFDRFAQHQVNLTPSEFNGLNIFTTEKGDCFHCHSLGLFTDNKFHNIGIDSTFSGINMGRYNVTANPNDMGLFKTPTLRNVELTPPYMHDGRFQTLAEVVDHYDMHVKVSPTVDPLMTKASKAYGLGLTPQEKTDLINFLKTLTDTVYTNNPALHP